MIILFGLPGSGKNFLGRLLAKTYGYYFYDGDKDLTPEMKTAIQHETIFTQAMRDDYFTHLTQRISELAKKHNKLVVAQGLAKEKNRIALAKEFPDAEFVWLQAKDAIRYERLQKRSDGVTIAYSKKIESIFEPPELPHRVIHNNTDEDALLKQF